MTTTKALDALDELGFRLDDLDGAYYELRVTDSHKVSVAIDTGDSVSLVRVMTLNHVQEWEAVLTNAPDAIVIIIIKQAIADAMTREPHRWQKTGDK